MRIGILSDTHNHEANTQAALERFEREGVRRLFHCGDITGRGIVLLFANFEVTFVKGNGDWPGDLLEAMLVVGAQRTLPARWAGTVGGRRLAMTHGDSTGVVYDLVHHGDNDYVFHGHSHRRRDERVGEVRVINPGALGGKHDQSRSIAILDLAHDRLDFVDIAA